MFLRRVLAGASWRGAAQYLAILGEAFGWLTPTPPWTTGRLWRLRLGHFMLTVAKERGDDWAWLSDHAVRSGPRKCLALLGLPLSELPAPGQALTATDVALRTLVPGAAWTKEEVDQQLEIVATKIGSPRAIARDHGAEGAGGVRLVQERHPETVDLYDTKHKAACVLKRLLGKDARWQEFPQKVGQTRWALQQTERAYLLPPRPQLKARFMNLGATLPWANKIVAILQEPPAMVRQTVTPERLREKLGWVLSFAAAVAEGGEWQALVDAVVGFVSRHGIYRGGAKAVRAVVPPPPSPSPHASSVRWRAELLVFLVQQARGLQPGERVPGSTELLESLFGHMKQLEKQQARGGFTTLLLAFGARLAETTASTIKQALEHSPTKRVYEWCKEHLGTTVFGQRKLAFAAAQQKPDEG